MDKKYQLLVKKIKFKKFDKKLDTVRPYSILLPSN